MVDEDGAWKQRINKENRRLFEPNFLYDDFMRSRQLYTASNQTARLINADGRINMEGLSSSYNAGPRKNPFDFGNSSGRGQPLNLVRAPGIIGKGEDVNNSQEDRYSRYSNSGSQPADESKLVRLRRPGAKKNRFNELLEVSRDRRQGVSNLNPETLSQMQSQQNNSRLVLQTPSQRSRNSMQSKVQSARSASMYGNFMKRREVDQVSEAAVSKMSKSNLSKLPDLTPPNVNMGPISSKAAGGMRTPGGSQRRKILSTILDRLCEMDSDKLAMIQTTLAGVAQGDDLDAVEDQDVQIELGENGEPLEEIEEFDIEQI